MFQIFKPPLSQHEELILGYYSLIGLLYPHVQLFNVGLESPVAVRLRQQLIVHFSDVLLFNVNFKWVKRYVYFKVVNVFLQRLMLLLQSVHLIVVDTLIIL